MSVATVNFTGNDVSIVPVGSPSSARVSRIRILNTPTSLTTGDFDNDGRVDIAIVGSPFGQLLTLLGTSDGSFVLKR